MRTGRTLTVSGGGGGQGLVHPRRIFWEKKIEKKRKKNLETPQIWRPSLPPPNLETPQKFGDPPENLEDPPKIWRPPKNLEPPPGPDHPPC